MVTINLSPAERQHLHAELKRCALRVGTNPDALPVAEFVLRNSSELLPRDVTPEALVALLRWIHAAALVGQSGLIAEKIENEAAWLLPETGAKT